MTNLLEMRDIRRRVNDSFALDGVNLAVGEGEVVGLVGANGAGKTTTIRAALGLLSLDSGELSLFGNAFGALDGMNDGLGARHHVTRGKHAIDRGHATLVGEE